MLEQYESGNKQLLELFETDPFDKARAEEIICTIADLNVPILNRFGFSSTYLYVAQECNCSRC